MDDKRAQSLQKRAIDALSELQEWIWAQHSLLLPDDVSAVTHERAQLYSAYLEWYSGVEEALKTLASAAGTLPSQKIAEDPGATPTVRAPATLTVRPPTATPAVRAPAAPRPACRSGVWLRTIPILAPADDPPTTRRSAA